MAVITEASLRAGRKAGLPNPFALRCGDRLTPAAADYLKEQGIRLLREPNGQPQAASGAGADAGARQAAPGAGARLIPVGVSGRHVHLSPAHVAALFGPGHALTPLKELSQPGQFAAKEQVTLQGPAGQIRGVRVLAPSRGETQVEISKTDGYTLGVHPPVRLSGSLAGTPGIVIEGPYGSIALERGLIVARNHVHMSPEEAAAFGVADGDRLTLRAGGERKLEFADVIVRMSPRYRLDFHIDMDEANAAALSSGQTVELIGVNGVRVNGAAWR